MQDDTVQYAEDVDRYLHTNFLAALGNMSGLFNRLQITDSLLLRRTIQYNMLKMCDPYLHTNCLAALANMSGLFKHFHIIKPTPSVQDYSVQYAEDA
jgi:hypothetical protein